MKKNLSTQELVNRNRKIVGALVIGIGVIFLVVGALLDNSSFVVGGMLPIIIGFTAFILPGILNKK